MRILHFLFYHNFLAYAFAENIDSKWMDNTLDFFARQQDGKQ